MCPPVAARAVTFSLRIGDKSSLGFADKILRAVPLFQFPPSRTSKNLAHFHGMGSVA